MKNLILGAILVAVASCAQVDPDTYKTAGSTYGQSDGLFVDSTGNLHFIVNGSTVGNITSAGVLTTSAGQTLGGDITMENGAVIDNDTDGAFTYTEASEDLIYTYTTNDVAVTSSTGVTEIDFGTITLETAAIHANGAGTFTTLVNGEDLVYTGSANAMAVSSSTGLLEVDFGTIAVGADVVATHLQTIRFCGNGINGATAAYMGPVLLDDTEADLAFGGAGCDALDNTTEATADAPWHSSFAFLPVSMVCVGRCTGASAANDAITYQLRDDTADVTGMACTAGAWTGDDDIKQCKVQDLTPATVAANSAIAIKMSGTDDACTDAGDDFECLLYVSF